MKARRAASSPPDASAGSRIARIWLESRRELVFLDMKSGAASACIASCCSSSFSRFCSGPMSEMYSGSRSIHLVLCGTIELGCDSSRSYSRHAYSETRVLRSS